MSTSAQRKAWNDAMRLAVGGGSGSASLLPKSLQTASSSSGAAGGTGMAGSTGGGMLSSSSRRTSDRRKKQDRRDKARKSGGLFVDASDTSPDAVAFRASVWMDALEGVPTMTGATDDDGAVDGGVDQRGNDDDDEYDELEELGLDDDDDSDNDHDDDGKNKKRKRGRSTKKRKSDINTSKRQRKSGGGGGKSPSSKSSAPSGILPKRFKARLLANVLLEEVNRSDGVAYEWLNQEARSLVASTQPTVPSLRASATTLKSDKERDSDPKMEAGEDEILDTTSGNKFTKSSGGVETLNPNKQTGVVNSSGKSGRGGAHVHGHGGYEQLPPRKFCPVTGQEGIYCEPKTRIPYANLKALEQIRERPPPWMSLSGNASYHEAVKSIRDE